MIPSPMGRQLRRFTYTETHHLVVFLPHHHKQ